MANGFGVELKGGPVDGVVEKRRPGAFVHLTQRSPAGMGPPLAAL